MSYTLGMTSPLGIEPDTTNHLNGGSSQQESIVSYNGYQYVGYWRDASSKSGCRHMILARRRYEENVWKEIEFTDYEQTIDDGHNTICIGICVADGTLHAAYDHHDTPLNYRVSSPGLITNPSQVQWSTESFGSTMHALPIGGPVGHRDYFEEVTYPRFVALTQPRGGLALEYRTGISGLGDCWLFVYNGDGSGTWIKRGKYLQGVENNPYLNGIDVDAEGALHVSWCYRDYVPVTLEQSRAQAGPNGPENNHDVMYAYSPAEADGSGPGLRWFVSDGTLVGKSDESPIKPDTKGALVFTVAKYTGGSLNQEAQCVDCDGNVHVLNRERHEGVDHWYHYCRRALTKDWSRHRVPIPLPSYLSARGKLLSLTKSRSIALILPLVPDLVIYTAPVDGASFQWEEVGRVTNGGAIEAPHVKVAPNVTGGLEPAIDRLRASEDGCISVFVGVTEEGVLRKELRVVDFMPSDI